MVWPWRLNGALVLGLVGYLGAFLPRADGNFGLTSSKDELVTVALDEEDNHTAGRDRALGLGGSPKARCDILLTDPVQKKMCRRQQMADVLIEATRLSVLECQYQYRNERWNCSMAAKQRLHTLNTGFKETGFMFAVSSAGLVHAVARACGQGQLDRCTCDDSYNPSKNKEAWMWGGCGDNIRYGYKFTQRFLKSHQALDLKAKVDQHNTNVGTKVVRDGISKSCKCHGVSGSCTVKTCWRQLSPFQKIGDKLKRKADQAIKVISTENTAKGKSQLIKRRKNSANPQPKQGDLVFFERSPNFCLKSPYSFGSEGRKCEKANHNCDVMCCGRGYNTLSRTAVKPCDCKVIWCCEVKCNTCQVREEFHTCK